MSHGGTRAAAQQLLEMGLGTQNLCRKMLCPHHCQDSWVDCAEPGFSPDSCVFVELRVG